MDHPAGAPGRVSRTLHVFADQHADTYFAIARPNPHADTPAVLVYVRRGELPTHWRDRVEPVLTACGSTWALCEMPLEDFFATEEGRDVQQSVECFYAPARACALAHLHDEEVSLSL